MKNNYLEIKVVVASTHSEFRYICQNLDIDSAKVKYVSLAEVDTGLAGYTREVIYPNIYGRYRPNGNTKYPQYTIKRIDGKWWVIDPEGKQHSSPSAKEGGAQSLAVALSHEPQHHCHICNDYLALSEMSEHMFWLHGLSANEAD